VPTFIFFNIPLVVFGAIVAVMLWWNWVLKFGLNLLWRLLS